MLGNTPERKYGKRKFMYPDIIIYMLPFQDFRIKKTFINVEKLIALDFKEFLFICTMKSLILHDFIVRSMRYA